MNRSQLFRRHARSAVTPIGTMHESDRCAATSAPGANFCEGPFGPSGVIATAFPASSSRLIEISARSAPRLLEPRISPYPSAAAALATISPSLCSLIRTTTPSPRCCQSSGNSWPCQSEKTKPRFARRSFSHDSRFTLRMRQVIPSARSTPLPKKSPTLADHGKSSPAAVEPRFPLPAFRVPRLTPVVLRAHPPSSRLDRPRREFRVESGLRRDRRELRRA